MKELIITPPEGIIYQVKNYIVYKHISPSGKVYIGITSRSAKERWGNGNYYKDSKKFYNAILKYGWENIKHEILLENQSESAAKYTEKYLIQWYKMHNISYNITDGGEGTCGFSHPMSEKCKEAIRKANIGRKLTLEQKENLRKLHIGKKFSKKTIEKLKISHLGHKDSDQTKLKKSISAKGKKKSKEAIENFRKSRLNHKVSVETHSKIRNTLRKNSILNKPILQYTLDGKFIREFISSAEAGRIINADPSGIRKAVKGIYKTYKNYIWKQKV